MTNMNGPAPEPSRKSPPDKSFPLAPATYEDLELLKPLEKIQLFIIQPKVDDYGIDLTDFFHPSTTHEIYTDKRHLLFRGASKRKLFSRGKNDTLASKKISITNLRKKKLLTVQFESSALANEAIVCCPHISGMKYRVVKYGGLYEAPSYSMSSPNSDCPDNILFSVDNSPGNSISHHHHHHSHSHSFSGNGNGSSSGSLEYNVFKSSKKLVGRITSKSGLNFMLHVADGVPLVEKASLLGLVVAMDMLKQGKAERKNNDYEYNT